MNIEKSFRQMIEEIYNKNHKNIEAEEDEMEVQFSNGQTVDLQIKIKEEDKKCC